MKDIVIYVKTTNECQLKCEHCYNTVSPFKGTMIDNVVQQTIQFIKEKAKDNNCLVIFHGGEPMMGGIDKIQTIIKSLETIENIKFTITTNLMYKITDDHIKLFEKMATMSGKNLVSTSWDYKIRFANNEQEQLWENNVKLLLKHNINVAPIVSITSLLINETTPYEILLKFKDMGITRMNFERLTETGRASDNKSLKALNKDVDEWLYQAYITAKELDVVVSLFDGLKQAIFDNNFVGCRKRECQKNVITINPDGTIAGCPNCSNNIYGNIDGRYNEQLFNKFALKEEIKSNDCYLCDLYEYCNGDCFQLQWDKTGCPALKKIIKSMIEEKDNGNI